MRGLLLTAIAMLALPGAGLAASSIAQPSCTAIEAWAVHVDAQNYNVAPRILLPKALEDAQIVPLFGVRVLAWTHEDLQAANQLLTKCWNEARRRRDGPAVNAFVNGNRALQGWIPRVNAILQKAKADAAPLEQKIAALPDSADLDRGIAALLTTDPALPDPTPFRTLPREIADPLWRLASQVLPFLANGERETLFSALGQRHAAMQTAMAGVAAKTIDSTPDNADGVITLTAVRLRIATLDDADMRARLLKASREKAQKIRAALRRARPALWVPPGCLDLYRWSSAPNARLAVNIGARGALWTAFTDARAIPVFGISLGAWTDGDLARFKALRGACSAEWRAEAALPAKSGRNAPELVQLVRMGGWIDGADRQISDARNMMAAYQKSQHALATAIAKVRALPDDPSSLQTLRQLLTDPTLGALSPGDRTAYVNAVNAKLAEIGARAADAAVKGLNGITVSSYADVDKLWAFGAQAIQTIPDPGGRQTLINALTRKLQDAAQGLRRGAKTSSNPKPASLASVANANMEILRLRTVSFQVANSPVFRAYVDALRAGRDALATSARTKICTDFVSGIGADRNANEPVWDGREAMSLGEFLCEAAEHGTVNSYAGPGVFSRRSIIRVTPLHSQTFTILLHKVEVQAGHPMLVGYAVKDAAQASGPAPTGQQGYSLMPNGPITVEGWERFLPNVIGFNGSEDATCMTIIYDQAPDKLPTASKIFYLHCWTMPSVRDHVASRGSPGH